VISRRYFLAAAWAFSASPAPAPFDWKGLAHTLNKYVTADGKVRYGDLKQDLEPLRATAAALAKFNPESLPSREAKLAHWINVYNTFILLSFAEDYPEQKNRLKNPLKRAAYFYRRKFPVAGGERTLADIEDNSIRSMGDPRIHFAIVCASASCPWLSRTVYDAANLEKQLETETNRFLGQSRNVTVDKVRRTATVSEIFKWFRKDFGGSEEAVLRFLANRLPSHAIQPSAWKLRYFDYDWSINDVR
jgi:hypothetical protein